MNFTSTSILLVDDEESIRVGTGNQLKKAGYEVVTANCGQIAINILDDRKFDVVITDLAMTEVDGIQVLEHAKKSHPETMVVIMTAYGSLQTAIEALRKNADDYILKPCDKVELLRRVGRCVEKIRLNRELKATREKLEMLSLVVEQSPDSVIITDPFGRIQYVNDTLSKTSGYSREELYGKTPGIFKSGKHKDSFYKKLWETVKSGKEFRAEFQNMKKDGSLIWELQSIFPSFNAEGEITHFVSVKIDDTERKQAEEKVKLYAAELERSNRELNAFTAIASHDLKEPLRKILSFGERLQETASHIDEKSRDYLRRMQKAAQRMQNLIDDLLQYSRVTTKAKPFEPVDLNV